MAFEKRNRPSFQLFSFEGLFYGIESRVDIVQYRMISFVVLATKYNGNYDVTLNCCDTDLWGLLNNAGIVGGGGPLEWIPIDVYKKV